MVTSPIYLHFIFINILDYPPTVPHAVLSKLRHAWEPGGQRRHIRGGGAGVITFSIPLQKGAHDLYQGSVPCSDRKQQTKWCFLGYVDLNH